MPKVKAYWKGHEIYQIREFKAGFARISYWASYYESPWTGTGGCWAPIDEIVIEEAEEEEE